MSDLTLETTRVMGGNRAEKLGQSISRNSDDKKLREASQEFEAMFIKQMLSSMKKTVNKSGLIKENMGEKIFDDMLYDEYAKSMAVNSSFGIADMIYREMAVEKYQ